MSERVAFVMKLRDGVTHAEIRELTTLLDRVADPAWMNPVKTAFVSDPENCTRGERCIHQWCRTVETPLPNREKEIFQKYEDEHGDPCFYIP